VGEARYGQVEKRLEREKEQADLIDRTVGDFDEKRVPCSKPWNDTGEVRRIGPVEWKGQSEAGRPSLGSEEHAKIRGGNFAYLLMNHFRLTLVANKGCRENGNGGILTGPVGLDISRRGDQLGPAPEGGNGLNSQKTTHRGGQPAGGET